MRRNKYDKPISTLGFLKNSSKLEVVILTAILLIGVFFRFYKFKTIPFGLNHDAALNGLVAIDLWQKLPYYTPYYFGWIGETLYHYWLGLNFFFFGINDTNLRLASIIIGTLTLPVYYLLARLLQDKTTAYFSLFFIAISGWHITMSKVGWLPILVPLFQSFLFIFLYKSLKEDKKVFWALSGIMLALTLNTYGAARITPFIVGLILSFWYFIAQKKLRVISKNLFLFFFWFLLTILPLLNFAIRDWDTFTDRAKFLAVTNRIKETNSFKPVIDNIQISFGMLHARANGNDFFVNEPLLEKTPGYLFFLGLIYLIFTFKKLESFFILSWFFLGFIPGILSIPNGNHNFTILAPVYLIIGQGIATIIVICRKITPRYSGFGYLIVILIMLFSIIDTYNQYLSSSRREIWGFYPETTIVANFMNQNKNKFEFYLTDNYPRDALTFLTYSGGDPFQKHYIWFDKTEFFFTVEKNPNKGLMFFMMDTPQNTEVRNKLLAKFPNSYLYNLVYTDDYITHTASSVVIVPSSK